MLQLLNPVTEQRAQAIEASTSQYKAELEELVEQRSKEDALFKSFFTQKV